MAGQVYDEQGGHAPKNRDSPIVLEIDWSYEVPTDELRVIDRPYGGDEYGESGLGALR